MKQEENKVQKVKDPTEADQYLTENIEEAKADTDKAFDLYRNYVGGAETREERMRRIQRFRCGGRF